MPNLSWIEQERRLTGQALTVRAQTISPNDRGALLYDAFFPRRDVDSVVVRNISDIDFRPVADRREWNTRGRAIPIRTPSVSELEMMPVESYFTLAEREIQELMERTLGNEQMFRDIIKASIPARVDALALANYRRIEVDAMTAWALGTITVRNPQHGDAVTVSLGFNAARYETAGTAYNLTTNAYNDFMAFLRRATDMVGPLSGVMLRQATLNEIVADAPNVEVSVTGITPSLRAVEARIQDERGSAFRFYVNENTADIFGTASQDVVRTKIWPTGRIAVIPAGEQVGVTAFAPVARAFELAAAAPDANIDVRGMTAYVETANGGRMMTTECQANALSLPNEQRVFVTNAGV